MSYRQKRRHHRRSCGCDSQQQQWPTGLESRLNFCLLMSCAGLLFVYDTFTSGGDILVEFFKALNIRLFCLHMCKRLITICKISIVFVRNDRDSVSSRSKNAGWSHDVPDYREQINNHV